MTQVIEAVAFSTGNYQDNLAYFTTAGKLRASQGGMKWFTLTPNRPARTFRIKLRPKSKRMVPYSFFGVLTTVPNAGGADQLSAVADTTDITHVYCTHKIRYLEWNDNFDMMRV